MKMTATPRSRACRTYLSTTPACLTPSAEVGSSRISTRAPKYTARAIATDCRSPPESVPTGWSGSRMSIPISFSSLRTIRFAVALSNQLSGPMCFRGSAPRKKFRQVVVDGCDPVRAGVARRGEVHLPAVDEHPALVCLVDPGEDLDEARLAGA